MTTIGRFEILRELGRGGMGVVYQAHDPELQRDVALKVLLPSESDVVDSQRLLRFREEALTVARLQHPSIVRLHEAGDHEGNPYLVMEFVVGETLTAECRRGLPPARRVAEVCRDVARALAHAHANRVVHRDVKPDNVLIDESGRARLTDFGLARDVERVQRLTQTGQMLGTPAFMAPEQVSFGIDVLGPATDVYGLGGLLYYALCGQAPVGATTVGELIPRILRMMPEHPQVCAPTADRGLGAVALRCLEKEPKDRYPSATAVADELDRFLAGEPLSVDADDTKTRRQRRLAGVLVLTALGVALTLAALVGRPPEPVAPAPAPLESRSPVAETHEGSAAKLALWAHARAALARLDALPDDALGSILPDVKTLAALAAARADAPPLPAVEFVDRLIQRLLPGLFASTEVTEVGLSLVYELSLAGVHPSDRITAEHLIRNVVASNRLGVVTEAQLWKTLLAAARLDIDPTSAHVARGPHLEIRLNPDQGPWERYVVLFMEASRTKANDAASARTRSRLAGFLADPPEPMRLGPKQRAAALALAFAFSPTNEKLEALETARELDPRSPWVRRQLARLYADLARHTDAVREAEASLKVFRAGGYSGSPQSEWEERFFIGDAIRVFTAAGEAKRARALVGELERMGGPTKKLLGQLEGEGVLETLNEPSAD